MKSKLFSQKIITDPTLLFGKQLQLEFIEGIAQEKILDSFESFLNQVQMAMDIFDKSKQKGKQITFVYSAIWLDFEKKLIESGWQKSLASFEYSLKNLEASKSENYLRQNGFVISKNSSSFSEIRSLLVQQAQYHSDKYPEYYKNVMDMDWEEYEKITTDDLLHNLAHNLFLSKDNKIVGLILSEIRNNTAMAYEFVIDENLRGKGIGTQLLHQYLSFSKQDGLQDVILETWWNQPSRKLYERFGFVNMKSECFISF